MKKNRGASNAPVSESATQAADLTQTPSLSSEENFHQILNAIGDLVLVKGPKSKLLWANESFCTYYGMSNSELRGLIDAPFSEPDFTQKYVRDDEQVFNSGEILDIPQEPVKRFDGETRFFHTVKSPIFDAAGKVIMTVGISRDITDRLEIEKDLEVQRARSLYSAKMATLGEMAGGIAHEINTPLAAIQLIAGQIQDILGDAVPDLATIKKSAAQVEGIVSRIAQIILALRTFSREAGVQSFKATSLNSLMDDTLALSRERLVHHGIEVAVEVEEADLIFDCCPIQISQVLINLLNNAHDAIVETKGRKWIHVSAKQKDDMVEIAVTDSGSGLSKEMVEKIFTPFFTTKEIGKGTGLGLSISKGIAEAHRGQLFVDQSVANTRFVLQLPVKQNSIKTEKDLDHSQEPN